MKMANNHHSDRKIAIGNGNNHAKDTSLLPNPNPSLLSDDPLGLANTTTPTPTPATVHPDFLPTLEHLSQHLVELVSLTTSLAHPSFPDSLLKYHLLTNAQLDDLARHYHQVWPPTAETFQYPVPVPAWIGTANEHTVDIETKRRRLGRFIGLTGCASPPPSKTCFAAGAAVDEGLKQNYVHQDDKGAGIENMMDREWEEALRRARNEEGLNVVLSPKTGSC